MSQSVRDKAWETRLRSLGLAVLTLEKWADSEANRTLVLTGVRLKLDADNGTSVLCILKAVEEGLPVVGFVGGLDVSSVLLALAKRLRGEAVRWREDVPWADRPAAFSGGLK